jgi:hypothetical protein
MRETIVQAFFQDARMLKTILPISVAAVSNYIRQSRMMKKSLNAIYANHSILRTVLRSVEFVGRKSRMTSTSGQKSATKDLTIASKSA